MLDPQNRSKKIRKEVKKLERKTKNFLDGIGENGKPLLLRPFNDIPLRDDLLKLSGRAEEEAKEMCNRYSKKSMNDCNERLCDCIDKINAWDRERADHHSAIKVNGVHIREFLASNHD